MTPWVVAGFAQACSSAPSTSTETSATPSPSPFQIVPATGGGLEAVAGDALLVRVVAVGADGSVGDLPAGSDVVWTSPSAPVTALPPNSDAPSPMPVVGSQPTVAWIANPSRPDRSADLANVLFILDPGTVQNAVAEITATVSGASTSSEVTASLTSVEVTALFNISATPAGDWTRGATLYGPSGANCAACHGPTGHGSAANADGTYSLDGSPYSFPAPGLNAEPGNTAGDPVWNAALFAVASRADMDNEGISLRQPMPDWLMRPGPTGQPLTTQDFADIFAFLKTQIQ
jgi:mono/diheme cytochrome c family protein